MGSVRSLLVLLGLVLVPVALAVDQPGPNDYGPLPSISAPSVVSHVDPRFSRAASLVSGGKVVEARCWSNADWERLRLEWYEASDGSYMPDIAYLNPNDPEPRRVQITTGVCSSLAKLTYRRGWLTTSRKLDLAFAVVTLAHEAQHVRGFASEPVAECYGMQRARIVGRALGLTIRQANDLVAVYWRFGYQRKPASYKSVACRNGGALDLNLTRLWP